MPIFWIQGARVGTGGVTAINSTNVDNNGPCWFFPGIILNAGNEYLSTSLDLGSELTGIDVD